MEDQIQLSSNDMANDNVSVTQKNNKELEAVPTVLFRTSMTLRETTARSKEAEETRK